MCTRSWSSSFLCVISWSDSASGLQPLVLPRVGEGQVLLDREGQCRDEFGGLEEVVGGAEADGVEEFVLLFSAVTTMTACRAGVPRSVARASVAVPSGRLSRRAARSKPSQSRVASGPDPVDVVHAGPKWSARASLTRAAVVGSSSTRRMRGWFRGCFACGTRPCCPRGSPRRGEDRPGGVGTEPVFRRRFAFSDPAWRRSASRPGSRFSDASVAVGVRTLSAAR